MSVDVFITTNNKRPYFLELTKKALELSGYKPIIVQKPMLERYYECERLSTTPIYILIDDDIIPATSDTLQKLVETMEKYPELSQLGLGWKSEMGDEYNSSWRRGIIGEDVWEFDHCGGCIAIRKGTIHNNNDKCDYANGIGDDKIVGMNARKAGYKVGIAHKLFFHHLGGAFSTVWHEAIQ